MNLKTIWVLQIDPSVSKTLKKIPQNYTKRIITAIETLPQNPFAGDIQKMKDEKNVWRRREGNIIHVLYDFLQTATLNPLKETHPNDLYKAQSTCRKKSLSFLTSCQRKLPGTHCQLEEL